MDIPNDCRLVFCVGVGGVGKTTFSAALGLREALRGRSVLVLTADPARRLADALGVHRLDDVPSHVTLPKGAGVGDLHAAMLETKSSADAIIRRAAEDPARAQRVLDNRIYQAFSNTLARSHAYAAMERIHETIHDPGYDLVIVDTPPSQSSVEILDAPLRLVRFLDQRVVRWFLRTSGGSGGPTGSSMAQRLLRSVAGESLVAALTEFLSEMAFLREGFARRAREVREIMQSAQTRFLLVSSPDPVGVEAARSVASELSGRDFRLEGIVFNRAFIQGLEAAPEAPAVYPPALSSLGPTLRRMREWAERDQARKARSMASLCDEIGVAALALPEATRPLGSTSALAEWVAGARVLQAPG